MGEALNNASGQVDQLEAAQKNKDEELRIKDFEAQTARIKVESESMTPQQMQAFIMQTIQQTLAPNTADNATPEEVMEFHKHMLAGGDTPQEEQQEPPMPEEQEAQLGMQ